MIEVFKQMVGALEDTSASKHISRNAAIRAGLKAIKELESQEPVAWADHGVINWIADMQFKHASYLYTHPRTWQGLTDEEVESYWDWEDFQTGAGRLTIFEMVRYIEAKLKERNT